MFICIKQAETDQGSLNNDFSKYSQAVPSTPTIGIHQKIWVLVVSLSDQSMTDNGVTSYILLSILLKNELISNRTASIFSDTL